MKSVHITIGTKPNDCKKLTKIQGLSSSVNNKLKLWWL